MEQSQQQKYLMIGLAVVVVVLAGVIAVLVMGSNKGVDVASTPATGTGSSAQQMPPGGTGGTGSTTPATPSNFDPASATKVPAGTDPKQFVDEYYAAVMKKDYTTAFKHLPADKQTGSSPDALKQQLEGYGITGYEVTAAQEQGDQYSVSADQITSSYGTFSNTWIFVKDGDAWLVQSKAVTGMK